MLPKWQSFPMVRVARVPASATAVATALLLVPLASMSSATFPGGNGRLAYAVGGGEENYVLRTVKADGTRDRRLLGATRFRGGFYRGPSGAQWSADGRRLLFGGHSHLDQDATSLWYASASAKRVKQIRLGLRRPLRLYGWAWAPDGRHVVFAAGRAARYPRSRIYTIALDGSQRRALTRGDRPSWSSDGRHIVFQRDYPSVGLDSARRGVFIIRPDGTHLRRLTASTQDRLPSFSPDGRRVTFVREVGEPLPVTQHRTEWHTVDIAGRHDRLVASRNQWPFVIRYGAPQWAPDGTRLSALREDASTLPIPTVAFVTVAPTGTGERVEFPFPKRPSGYTYYAGDFSGRPR